MAVMNTIQRVALTALLLCYEARAGPAAVRRSYDTTTTVTHWHTLVAGSTISIPSSSRSYSRGFSLQTTAPVAVGYSNNSSETPSPNNTTSAQSTTLSSLPLNTSVPLPSASATLNITSTKSDSVDSNNSTGFLRGVNVGNWLILEKWMDSTQLFSGNFGDASDQYTFDQISGSQSALQQHWSTWFTEADVQKLASTGINALRIPIGWWAFDNSSAPYQQGAADYLDQAIGWARNANMKVWIDSHGSPGSQNGFDNSGHAGSVDWQQSDNIEKTITILETMASKYGSPNYADTVVGLELVNEPISWGANQFSTTQQFAREAYSRVRAAAAAAGNPNLNIVMHDAFQSGAQWTTLPSELGTTTSRSFHLDTHMYQVFTDSDKSKDQSQHIAEACSWGATLASTNAQLPIHVGEWTATTNFCVNPDGTSTIAGSSCYQDGCRCSSDPIESWNDALKEQTRRFVEAQLDAFEENASGYFFWAYKGPGAWGFEKLIDLGIFPNPVTDRKYPGQCGGGGGSGSGNNGGAQRRRRSAREVRKQVSWIA
ncbi:MAG: hypothetical protein Q9227_002399 [Pyrenula ochraceoflavens]